jgi:hypothetical protein
VRGRITALDGRTDDDRMRALARETFHARIEDSRVVELPDPAVIGSARPSTARGWLKWSTSVGAVATLAAGGALLYLHETCGPEGDPCRGNSPTLAYVSIGAGVALGAVATYLFVSDDQGSRGPRLSLQPTRHGAMVGVSLAY